MGAHVVYRLRSLFYTLLLSVYSWKSCQLPWLKLHTIIIYAINYTLYCTGGIAFNELNSWREKRRLKTWCVFLITTNALFFGEIIYSGQDIHGDFIEAKYRQSTTDVICCCWRCMNYFWDKNLQHYIVLLLQINVEWNPKIRLTSSKYSAFLWVVYSWLQFLQLVFGLNDLVFASLNSWNVKQTEMAWMITLSWDVITVILTLFASPMRPSLVKIGDRIGNELREINNLLYPCIAIVKALFCILNQTLKFKCTSVSLITN